MRFQIFRTSGEVPPTKHALAHDRFRCVAADGIRRYYSTRERAEAEIAKYGGNANRVERIEPWYSISFGSIEALLNFCQEVGECIIGQDLNAYDAPVEDAEPLPMIEIYDGNRE
jgi:hypothetical protein